MRYTFKPEIEQVGLFQPQATVAEFAEHGGPLTQLMLAQVPQSFYEECSRLNLYPNIDVRVHRLYPGDYPAVPGWHTDGEFS